MTENDPPGNRNGFERWVASLQRPQDSVPPVAKGAKALKSDVTSLLVDESATHVHQIPKELIHRLRERETQGLLGVADDRTAVFKPPAELLARAKRMQPPQKPLHSDPPPPEQSEAKTVPPPAEESDAKTMPPPAEESDAKTLPPPPEASVPTRPPPPEASVPTRPPPPEAAVPTVRPPPPAAVATPVDDGWSDLLPGLDALPPVPLRPYSRPRVPNAATAASPVSARPVAASARPSAPYSVRPVHASARPSAPSSASPAVVVARTVVIAPTVNVEPRPAPLSPDLEIDGPLPDELTIARVDRVSVAPELRLLERNEAAARQPSEPATLPPSAPATTPPSAPAGSYSSDEEPTSLRLPSVESDSQLDVTDARPQNDWDAGAGRRWVAIAAGFLLLMVIVLAVASR